jgi:hypothetical protein
MLADDQVAGGAGVYAGTTANVLPNAPHAEDTGTCGAEPQVMTSEAERHFHADMVAGATQLKREIGYNPTRFMQMVGELGGVEAARRLLKGRDASDGFTTLWEHGRLDVSVEAFVLLRCYRDLFADDQRETAERRLVDHRFDVAAFLRAAEARPPEWVADATADGA